MRLFLHDPNQGRRQALFRVLVAAGCQPETLEAPETVSALSALSGDAALHLPLVLGNDPGTPALVARMRRAGADNPILVMTECRQPDRDAKLLDAGACDVLSQPLHPVELAARLRAIVRRRTGVVQSEVRVGDLVVHLDGRDPTVDSKPVSLSSKENAVLCLLAAQRGRVLTRTAIFDLLYGLSDYQPFDKAIDLHICRIRGKLGRIAPHARRYIETLPGRGYSLRVPVAGD